MDNPVLEPQSVSPEGAAGAAVSATPPSSCAPVAREERGGFTESRHWGVGTLVQPGGAPVGSVGDAGLGVFLRSAAKPFQALPLVLDGGLEAYELADEDLALLCASHFGLPMHVDRVAAILRRAGLRPEQLACGVHWPFDRTAAEALRARGEQPTVLHNNCSGKHAGMLMACRLAGWPLEAYLDVEHPLQVRVRTHLAELAGLQPAAIGVGIDGCGAPCYYLPLAAAARAYAALAEPAAAADPAVAQALERIARAMAAAPQMIAGPGRFTTRLIEVTGGRILGKEGAGGFYALAVRGPVALGGALKILDGGERCRPGAVLSLLRQAGVLAGAEFSALAEFYEPELHNRQGRSVGRFVDELELRGNEGA